MRFTFRQLDYFIAAGETGSVTLAAERVGISQPSVSTAIAHLEREWGVQLFVRHHAQGLSLTSTGRTLLAEAKRVVAQAEALHALASDATGEVRGDLVLGCLVTLAPMVLPELVRSFTTAFPGARVRSVEDDGERLLDGLRRAEIDAAITYDLQVPASVGFTPLARLPAHALVGEAHPFAGRETIGLEDLAREPLVLLDLPLSRDYFLALFMRHGLTPVVGARSAHMEVVRTMVANGYGYTLANVRPRSDVALDGRRLVRVDLAGEHRPMMMGLARLARLGRSRLIDAFESHCTACITDASIPGMLAPDAQA